MGCSNSTPVVAGSVVVTSNREGSSSPRVSNSSTAIRSSPRPGSALCSPIRVGPYLDEDPCMMLCSKASSSSGSLHNQCTTTPRGSQHNHDDPATPRESSTGSLFQAEGDFFNQSESKLPPPLATANPLGGRHTTTATSSNRALHSKRMKDGGGVEGGDSSTATENSGHSTIPRVLLCQEQQPVEEEKEEVKDHRSSDGRSLHIIEPPKAHRSSLSQQAAESSIASRSDICPSLFLPPPHSGGVSGAHHNLTTTIITTATATSSNSCKNSNGSNDECVLHSGSDRTGSGGPSDVQADVYSLCDNPENAEQKRRESVVTPRGSFRVLLCREVDSEDDGSLSPSGSPRGAESGEVAADNIGLSKSKLPVVEEKHSTPSPPSVAEPFGPHRHSIDSAAILTSMSGSLGFQILESLKEAEVEEKESGKKDGAAANAASTTSNHEKINHHKCSSSRSSSGGGSLRSIPQAGWPLGEHQSLSSTVTPAGAVAITRKTSRQQKMAVSDGDDNPYPLVGVTPSPGEKSTSFLFSRSEADTISSMASSVGDHVQQPNNPLFWMAFIDGGNTKEEEKEESSSSRSINSIGTMSGGGKQHKRKQGQVEENKARKTTATCDEDPDEVRAQRLTRAASLFIDEHSALSWDI